MAVTLRDFAATDADYEAIVAIENDAYHGISPPSTVEQMQRFVDNFPTDQFLRTRVAESDGKVVGWSRYYHITGAYHPDKYIVNIRVRRDDQGRGIGSLIFDDVLADATSRNALCLIARAREDMDHALGFLARRGFVEERRTWESRLDVAACDLSVLDEVARRVEGDGIVIKSYAQLADDPDRDRKYYELDMVIEADMPRAIEFTGFDFDHFVKTTVEAPSFLPDAVFFALDGDRYVGLSVLWKPPSPGLLDTGNTGVLPEYRRRGIASALKRRAIDYARQINTPIIRTWNDSGNVGMLAINEKLGFARQPAWIGMIKTLREESP